MKTLLLVTSAFVLATGVAYGQQVQQVPHIPSVDAAIAGTGANVAPSWQAVCGYKWRQYRTATGASGRDAYYAFMRTPSAEGGCGAGETTRARPVQVRPNDEKIKQFLDHEQEELAHPHVQPGKQGAIERMWQEARGRKKLFGDNSDEG
jgi:hypothetical protein